MQITDNLKSVRWFDLVINNWSMMKMKQQKLQGNSAVHRSCLLQNYRIPYSNSYL